MQTKNTPNPEIGSYTADPTLASVITNKKQQFISDAGKDTFSKQIFFETV